MRYHDYMSQFTVIDETKSLIFSRMKQRAKQLKAAKLTREQTATAAARYKKNTFRLHLKRWVAIAVSAAVVVAAIPTVYFTAFHKRGNHYSLKLEYMENMMVETDGVTAYSIRSEEVSTSTPKGLQTDNGKGPAISLFSATILEDETGAQPYADKKKKRNYLYSTNENYEFGNVEYDENGITRVTFKKNSEVTEDVYDENGELIDSNRKIKQEEMDGQINKIYTTKEYTFIQFVPMVEQTGYYEYKTADGKKKGERVYLRPESMTYDENGVAAFDQGKYQEDPSAPNSLGGGEGCWTDRHINCPLSYYSSGLSASFVIDNSTGYIYKIESIRIDGFANGLVKSYVPDRWGNFSYEKNGYPDQKANYYSISTDENHNLIFTDVLPNKDIEVNNVFLDKYNWLYVVNNLLDEVDSDRRIIYTTDKYKYVHDSDNNVYVTNSIFTYENDSYWREEGMPALLKQMIAGEEVTLAVESVIRELRYIWRDWGDNASGNACTLTGKYQNLSVWLHPLERRRWHEGYYEGGNPDNYIEGWEEINYIVAYDGATDSGLVISKEAIGDKTEYGTYLVRWLDSNHDILLSIKNGKLFYAKVNLSECLTSVKTLKTNDFSPLSDLTLYEAEDYYLSVGQDQYKVNDVYYTVRTGGTEYYHVVRTQTGVKLEKLTSKAYADNVFIFQPINK